MPIHQALLELSQPILALSQDAGSAELERALKVTTAIWNAVVITDLSPEKGAIFLKMIRESLHATIQENLDDGVEDSSFVALFDQLVETKRRRFGHDQRMVKAFQIREKDNGEIELEVESSLAQERK